jgi:hypothetical protein
MGEAVQSEYYAAIHAKKRDVSQYPLASCRKEVAVLQTMNLRPYAESSCAPIDHLQERTIFVIKYFVIST